MISHEGSWRDIFVMQVSLLCQRYLTKLVGDIYVFVVQVIDTSDTSNTANLIDTSKTSASVTRLSS